MAFSIKDIGRRLLAQGARFMGGQVLPALNTNCPCCGQPLCPTGVVGAGFLALLISLPKWFRRSD